MKIFIDIDDTLLQTSKSVKGRTGADLLIAELQAPFFEGAEQTIELFKSKGFACFLVTQRGLISDEEITITKQRFSKEKIGVCFDNCVGHVSNKYLAIEKVYSEVFNSDIDKSNTIFIDNDVIQVANCANKGIPSILYAPDIENCSEEHEVCAQLNVPVAGSWDDIRDIVLNRAHGAKLGG